MRLSIDHRTVYRYDPAPAALALRLRLWPTQTAQQRLLAWSVSVNGEPVEPLLTTGYGQAEALWFDKRSSAAIEVRATGTVETVDAAGVLGREARIRPGLYRRKTELTEPDGSVIALAETAAKEADGEGALAELHALNAAVNSALDYRSGATDATTTAAQALALGAGVCQDFAQLFIAVSRHLGHPARYVVGYLHDAQSPEMASHAWAEAHVEGLGWIGFDPVHDVCPAETYVRLGVGFDAADAAPIRGTMRAGSAEEIDVSVSVAAGATQQQSQG
ncbi:MAG: transglutaminase family protein [Pseudomonadota bacterium]